MIAGSVKDPYQSLGVPRTATADEIKKQYRKLTRQYHPDRNPGDKGAEDKFKEVSSAYELLSDADRRKLFDEFGEMSLTQGFDPKRARAYKQAQQRQARAGAAPGFGTMFDDLGQAQETSFDELLSRLFGGGRVSSSGKRRGRGQDIEGSISVSLMDSLLGVTVPLRVENAEGESRTLDVKVPAGAKSGAKLRLRGQGGDGHPNGDILLTVKVKPGSRLKREGDDLILKLPVTAYEALKGGPIDVPTPWGTVTLKLPPGSQNGQTLRLRGKGVKTKRSKGDLLVKLDVRLPEQGDDGLLAALERAQRDQKPREGLLL